MSRVLRAALTETRNAYAPMPERVENLHLLAGKLDDVRRANVEHHVELIEEAAGQGVELICLGELFTAPYFALSREPMWLDMAEDALEGPTITELRATARATGVIVVAPIYELDATSGKRFNTAVVIDGAGDVLGKYRKVHIPCGSNEQGEFLETEYYERSDGELGVWPKNVSPSRFFPVFDTGKVKLGIAICYDRHFEGVVGELARGGAELIVSPAVTFGEKSRRMWDMEFCVDAMRHRVFIGGSNREGKEAPWNQEYFGASYFVGPNGRLPVLDGDRRLIIADLPLDELRGPDPSGWDLARDERHDALGDRGTRA